MIFPVTDDWDKLKGYSDITVSVQGLELLQTSLFIKCTKKQLNQGIEITHMKADPKRTKNGESLRF